MFRRLMALLSLPLLAVSGIGCAATHQGNTSFNVSMSDAEHVLAGMRSDPKPLKRPLVILSGFCDPGIAASHLRAQFRELTGDDRVIGVSFLFCGNFDECRQQVIAAVDKAFPSTDPSWTTEVDVVGVSMGGLVGRYAAVPAPQMPDARRLRVARLFTISTPHRGATLAKLPTFNQLQIDMRVDSTFLHQLAQAELSENPAEEPTVYPYVRLNDGIVGEANAAPIGQSPWWVPGEPMQDSHVMAMMDARIIADVARRLRGETPLSHDPPEPLPPA